MNNSRRAGAQIWEAMASGKTHSCDGAGNVQPERRALDVLIAHQHG
jgi:hypothetical protein